MFKQVGAGWQGGEVLNASTSTSPATGLVNEASDGLVAWMGPPMGT